MTVVSFDQARFVVEAMEMLAQYNEKVAPLKTLHKAIPFAARTQKGALIVAGPVDYLSWTQDIQRFSKRPDFQAKERVFLLRGVATPLAKTELIGMNWKIQEQTTRK